MLKFGHHFGSPTEDLLREVTSLSDQIFGSANIDCSWRLKNMPHVSIFYAKHESLLVGFKAGYAVAAMARINLRNGFSVVGTKLEPRAPQVLWSKSLA